MDNDLLDIKINIHVVATITVPIRNVYKTFKLQIGKSLLQKGDVSLSFFPLQSTCDTIVQDSRNII